MALLARNNATSTLSAPLTNVATSLSVQSGHGTRFPNPTGSDYFYVAIIGVGKYEVVKVTARSTDAMTIVRAQDNTTADSFIAGDAVKLLVTAVYITDTWTELGLKATINSPTFTGTPAAPTAAVDTNTTQVATTAYVVGQGYAKLASPALTGTPTAPTAAVDTNTTQVATTAYVVGQGYLKSATAASTYQPLDADLTSIAGLGYVSTSFLKKTAAGTWALDTATYEPTISSGTTAQYWRGDKTWQTLNATAVGLGNVTNESKATMFTSPTFTGTITLPTIAGSGGSSTNRLTLGAGTTTIILRATDDDTTPGRITLTASGGALVLPGGSGDFSWAGNIIYHAGNVGDAFTEARVESALSAASTFTLTGTTTLALGTNCNITAGAGVIYSTSVRDSTTASAANMYIDATGGFIQRSTSSIKYKKDVTDAWYGLEQVLKLRPVTYRGKGENDGDKVHGGLIAEEVYAAGLPEFVSMKNGEPDGLAYGHMVSLLVKAVQELTARVKELESK